MEASRERPHRRMQPCSAQSHNVPEKQPESSMRKSAGVGSVGSLVNWTSLPILTLFMCGRLAKRLPRNSRSTVAQSVSRGTLDKT